MSTRTWRLGLLAIGALALAIRVGYVLFVVGDDLAAGDAIYYSAQAEAITDGRWFEHPFFDEPAADHPPVTALILAPASIGGGDALFEQRLFMAALGTAAVIAIAHLGREVAGRGRPDRGELGGLVAGAAAAVYPGLWINDGLAMSETPTALVTALVLLVALRWRRDAAPGWMLGVLGGVAVLTRAELGLLMALVVVPFGLTGPWTDRLRRIALVTVVALLVVAPWTIRNLIRFEEPVLVSTNDGLTLIGANCDPAYYDAVGFWYVQCAPPIEGDQSEVSAEYRDRAFDYIGDNLDRLPRVQAARLMRAWSLYENDAMTYINRGEGRPRTASVAAWYGWWLLAPVAAGCLFLQWRRGGPVWVLIAPFITVNVVVLATYGIPRFRLPFEVAALASLAVLGAIAEDRRRSEPDAAVTVPVPSAS